MYQASTKLPNTLEFAEGVINLRGRIIQLLMAERNLDLIPLFKIQKPE